MKSNQTYSGLEIAITGMACRFPGAAGWRQYWMNIENGVEAISRFTDEELLAAGVEPELLRQPDYVKAAGVMPGKEFFDYNFFDYTHAEAKLMNPAHRVFHQLAWEALEDAGCNPDTIKGQVGVFAGSGEDFNWQIYTALKGNEKAEVDDFMLGLLKSKDHLATLLSYKLNFNGPSFNMNTACSTSLVAVNLACKSLLFGESKVALAGGVSINTHKHKGYQYKEGMIYSPDGHCRAFDKDAQGTVGSEGGGVVVLKRLNDALADGDHIYAIIKGSAINNDGNKKVGYTAPSVDGQAECIKKALAFAKTDAATIGYVETHGTGTRLGDPIEITALNMAYNNGKQQSVAIGSAKSFIGHTDSAAGVAGLMKTALALYYKKIPPSLHYQNPNPEIDFGGGPFYVNTQLKDWQKNGHPLRAAVSSFGIGGTNAHAVLEEAPAPETVNVAGRTHHILTLSAKTEAALERYTQNLYGFLAWYPETNPADLAYTLQTGRKHFTYRKQLLFETTEALTAMLSPETAKQGIVKSKNRQKSVVFMFPGQGAQYNNMCRGLYDSEPVFRDNLNKGLELIQKLTGEDYKAVLFPGQEGGAVINETKYTQPLIFLTEYALAQTLMALGVTPSCMIGHSIGEYAAAVIAGVMSLEDALRLVVKRAGIMSKVAPGAMVSAVIDEASAQDYMLPGVSLAAVNGPQQVVFSGSFEAMEALKEKLTADTVPHVTLHTSHAFHSGMLDAVLDEFEKEAAQIQFQPLALPFVSNLTGTFIKPEEAASPQYWVRHMRETVKFSQGLQTMMALKQDYLYVEVGPGHVLSSLLKQHAATVKPVAINTVRGVKDAADDVKYFTERLGQLWAAGAAVNWPHLYNGEKRSKLTLPVYSFEPVKFVTEVNPFEHLDLKTAVPASVQPAVTAGPLPETAVPVAATAATQTQQPAATVVTAALAEAEMEELSFDIGGAGLQQLEEQVVRIPRPELSTPYVAPATATEARLAKLLEDMFSIEKLGVEDNFLELGGDSLKGMVVIKKIKDEFSINMPLKDFFGKQNLREIALEIDKVLETAGEERPVKKSITI